MEELKNKIMKRIEEKLSGELTCADLAHLADACATLEKDEWLKKVVCDSQNLSFSGFGGSADCQLSSEKV